MAKNEEDEDPLDVGGKRGYDEGREHAERETLRKTKGIQEEKQMNYSDVLANARECIGKYCKACPVCNGVACKNQIPGPGAKGVGDTAIRNYNKWADIRVNMDTLCENGTPDTHVELFGRSFKYPFFAGPVGAVNLHYSDVYTDMTYNDVLVRACAESGIAAFTGDGTNPDVMTMATKAIGNADGCGVPTIKPWNIDTVKEKMAQAKASGCFAVAMDVDAAGLPFLKNMTPPAGSKSVAELAEIVKLAERPFIVKGVMTVKGALKAKEAGAAAIVVSNHGGRVSASVLLPPKSCPEIAAALKVHKRQVWWTASAPVWTFSRHWHWARTACSSAAPSSRLSAAAVLGASSATSTSWPVSWPTPCRCAAHTLHRGDHRRYGAGLKFMIWVIVLVCYAVCSELWRPEQGVRRKQNL